MDLHRHKGLDGANIDARDLTGPAVRSADLAVSSAGITILQRGPYTLVGGVKFITFPEAYIGSTNLQVLLTSKTTNSQFLDSVATSGFTVSGSGADTGVYLAIGYK